jgi:hypothetical protein
MSDVIDDIIPVKLNKKDEKKGYKFFDQKQGKNIFYYQIEGKYFSEILIPNKSKSGKVEGDNNNDENDDKNKKIPLEISIDEYERIEKKYKNYEYDVKKHLEYKIEVNSITKEEDYGTN